jgi:hypothetical protein
MILQAGPTFSARAEETLKSKIGNRAANGATIFVARLPRIDRGFISVPATVR